MMENLFVRSESGKSLLLGLYLIVALDVACGLKASNETEVSLNPTVTQTPTPIPLGPDGEPLVYPSTPEELSETEECKKVRENLAEYEKLPELTQLTEKPYIKGKMIVIDKSGIRSRVRYKEVEGLPCIISPIDSPMIARRAEDIGAIVFLETREEQAGWYTDYKKKAKMPGYISVIDVTIVDHTIPAIIYKKSVKGKLTRYVTLTKPTDTVSNPPPLGDVVSFLNKLPRKELTISPDVNTNNK